MFVHKINGIANIQKSGIKIDCNCNQSFIYFITYRPLYMSI